MNRRRTPRWAIAAAVGLVCAFARTGAAQQARGVVRDSAARAPLPGAVATLIDSDGRPGARTIADANGRFVLPLSRGAARIHVIRIGYRPVDVPLLSPATPGGDVTVDIAMPRLPPVLEAVRVTDQELCPGSTDRGAAFQLWEQARAGLLSSVVAREANPAMATTMIFERTIGASNDLIRRQTTVTRNGRTTRPFIAAAPPSEFAQVGYMTENAAGRTYSAPDADVLLDESFASSHCFHLQPSDDRHRDQLGLAFAPAPRATQIVDVSGVIWIDRQAPALRSLDFLFTNLEPAATRAGVGGHLEFHAVANGVSFVQWWVMRMPNLELSGQRPANAPLPGTFGASRQTRTDLRVTSIQEAGGEVLEASWSDGTIWHAEPSGFAGAVKQKGLDRTIPFALVTIAGTRDTITADDRGAFTLSPVPPGKYTVVVIDTTLRAFVAERTDSREMEVARGKLSPVRAELATIASVMADVCHGQKMRERTTSIVGRVMLSDGTLPAGIELRGRWQADFNLGSAVRPGSGEPLSIDESEQRINPDVLGRFAVCGVALDRPVQLRLTRGSEVADTTIFPRDSTFTRVEWRARLRPVLVAKAPESTAPSSSQTVSPAMRVVNERRRNAPAAFVPDSVLHRAGSIPLGDALRGHLSGLNIMSGSAGAYAVSVRDQRSVSMTSRDATRPACFATLYLDGTLLYELTTFDPREPPSLNGYTAEQMAAVEFYPAGSIAPSQFKPSECGVLLLWTRDR